MRLRNRACPCVHPHRTQQHQVPSWDAVPDHAYSLMLTCLSPWAAMPGPVMSAAGQPRAARLLGETLQSPHARARPTPILVANASAAAVRRASASSLPGSGRKAPGGGAGTTTTLFTLPSASHLRGSRHHWPKPIARTCHVGRYTRHTCRITKACIGGSRRPTSYWQDNLHHTQLPSTCVAFCQSGWQARHIKHRTGGAHSAGWAKSVTHTPSTMYLYWYMPGCRPCSRE